MSETSVPATDSAPAPDRPAGQTLRFSTTLRSRDYLVISLVNGVLNLITLTLYRFWGKTEVRRRIWRSVRLNDEAFEYTGRGKDLFFGFLIAVVVLGVPFLLTVFAIQFLGEGFYLLLFPGYLGMFWLFGLGMFTAFRYLASRTTWRGVRFSLGGSASVYGWTWLGMQVANGFTLGWTGPVFERMLAGQVWRHLRFGDRRFHWRVERSETIGLYGPFALGWFGTGLVFVLGVIAFGMIMGATGLGEALTQLESEEMPGAGFFIMFYGFFILLLPFLALIWAPYQSALLRSVAAGVCLEGARFRLNAGSLSLWWLTCTNYVMLFLSLGLLLPLIQARTAKYIVSRLVSVGEADLDAARQGAQGPRTAEGLADAFGFSFI